MAALLALLLPAPAAASAGTVVINASQPVRVWVSPSNQDRWVPAADHVPATIEVDGEVDVRVEGADGFFHLWRGEQPKVQIGSTVTVPTHRALAWLRIALVPVPLAIVLVGALWRRVRRLEHNTAHLEGRLEEAEAYSTLRLGALPKRIGPYRVLDRVGSGGMATVFRVEDAYGDVYALKVPDRPVLDNEAASQRFFREMDLGRQLHHPGIVRILDVCRGDADSYPYIAQEFIDGENLRAVLDRDAPFEERAALEAAAELADVLAYAHGQGVIHRDIKPGNIMRDVAGRLRVMDFGIAKVTTLETMTGTDTTLGTPGYMAPEQINSRHATLQSDLYALGVLLYEMLTGGLPFEEADPYRLLVRKMKEPAPRVAARRPSVSRRADNLVALLLEADPTKRPDSAETVARMLRLVMASGTA